MNSRIYLDYAATTPITDSAKRAMTEAFEIWANPSSPHKDGRHMRALIEEARIRIKAALNWPYQLVFTSGASESIAMVLQRNTLKQCSISAVEHDAFLRAGIVPDILPVDENGYIIPENLPENQLVAVQTVNNETGVIQPAEILAQRVREKNSLWFADAAQSAGKISLPDADFISISAHKLGGPPGIGALLIRDWAKLKPFGGQEQGYRAGTENAPAILAFAAAVCENKEWFEKSAALREKLDQAILSFGGEIVAHQSQRIPTIASYRMSGMVAKTQLILFDMAGISISAGSACSSGSLKSSPVLKAMGWGDKEAQEVIRVSFGRETTESDIDHFIKTWQQISEQRKKA
ncbi:MAG: aminotransferase class V-fold PLP-dependent enzyme [Zymomonas mobilis]|uniref:Cysteine desulfurase n=1 Tax=Zymomonas mobilis TaxID=542 RepID=A0A542W1H6_ZYMMB|nr:aminotransferase class V-fold PLP-dependent enzyme [Zymomonas mobilis]TQL17422.1 cysteine desulfurase [Zymomonas mobilis]